MGVSFRGLDPPRHRWNGGAERTRVSGLDLAPVDLAEVREGAGGGHGGGDGCDCSRAIVMAALAFPVGRSQDDRAGVLSTARAIQGGAFAPAGIGAARRAVGVEECLVTLVALGGNERPATGDGGGFHGMDVLRRDVEAPLAQLAEALDQRGRVAAVRRRAPNDSGVRNLLKKRYHAPTLICSYSDLPPRRRLLRNRLCARSEAHGRPSH